MKQLEQILEPVNSSKYKSIDIYTIETVALYTAPAPNFSCPLAYNDSASSPYERQTSLYDYGMPPLPEFKLPEIQPINIAPIEIVPYTRGMDMDGGFKLSGSKNTAILYDPYIDMEHHHHSRGGGSLNYGEDQFILPYEKQTK
jgi:hypothetical protein